MSAGAVADTRRPDAVATEPLPPVAARWYGHLGLLLASVALLTLSFAPIGQFYLAWVGLVPWLIVLHYCRSQRAAFFWSWVGGTAFFVANMWWLAYVTGPGMVALMALEALYWSVAGCVIRGTGLVGSHHPATEPGGSAAGLPGQESRPPRTTPSAARLLASVFLVSAVWVGLSEWFRGSWPLGGLPWLFMGHTQSPILAMCQIADLGGVYAVSFWVVLVNALVAAFILHRDRRRRLIPAGVAVAVVVLGVLGYGAWRFSTELVTEGPTVMVVQPNYPQSNSGEKGATQAEILDFHLSASRQALAKHPRGAVDLVVWSETMMPPLNPATRLVADKTSLPWVAHENLTALAKESGSSFLVGGLYWGDWGERNGEPFPRDRRNAAYYYTPEGGQAEARYDKIHIVPMGEYMPFKTALPPLYRLFMSLSPYGEDYTLTPGPDDALTVFPLGGWRFVAPICFEDIDPALCVRMFRPLKGGEQVQEADRPAGNDKRADLLVNITNDGWFKANQRPQHLQAAQFRSIENRVPTARAVNTGISGFVDPMGRTHDLLPAEAEGASVATLKLDHRLTLYTRLGDAFAIACAAASALLAAVAALFRWWASRQGKPTA